MRGARGTRAVGTEGDDAGAGAAADRRPALAGMPKARLVGSRLDRPRRDGALHRPLRLDPQAGGHRSLGSVGVHDGGLDVAQQEPWAHRATRGGSPGAGNATRQPTLTVPLSLGPGFQGAPASFASSQDQVNDEIEE